MWLFLQRLPDTQESDDHAFGIKLQNISLHVIQKSKTQTGHSLKKNNLHAPLLINPTVLDQSTTLPGILPSITLNKDTMEKVAVRLNTSALAGFRLSLWGGRSDI